MIEIRRSAIVRHTPEQMFDLVNDVEAYPSRFNWCVGAEVLSREADVVTARLDLKVAGLVQSFSTRNTLDRPRRLHMHLVEGPMRALEGTFTFDALGDEGCKVSLALDFDYPGRLGAAALRVGFKVLADRMVDDFCRVANVLHG